MENFLYFRLYGIASSLKQNCMRSSSCKVQPSCTLWKGYVFRRKEEVLKITITMFSHFWTCCCCSSATKHISWWIVQSLLIVSSQGRELCSMISISPENGRGGGRGCYLIIRVQLLLLQLRECLWSAGHYHRNCLMELGHNYYCSSGGVWLISGAGWYARCRWQSKPVFLPHGAARKPCLLGGWPTLTNQLVASDNKLCLDSFSILASTYCSSQATKVYDADQVAAAHGSKGVLDTTGKPCVANSNLASQLMTHL